jgi:hypothetical protein
MLKINKAIITVLLGASSRPCRDNFFHTFLYPVYYLHLIETDDAFLNRIAGEVKSNRFISFLDSVIQVHSPLRCAYDQSFYPSTSVTSLMFSCCQRITIHSPFVRKSVGDE